MMKNHKVEILYSDPVHEIISRPPRKIIRFGTMAIFLVFMLLILLSWLIKYPDVVPAGIEITTENPPATMLSKISGRIEKMFVTDSQNVKAGTILCMMESTASLSEIELLQQIVDSLNDPEALPAKEMPLLTNLGEIQSYYANLIKSRSDYINYVKNDFYGAKISSITEEISGLQEYVLRMQSKISILTENRQLEYNKYKRDSILFAGKFLSESDLEKSRQAYNLVNLELQQAGLDRSEKVIGLAEKRQLLQDYRITREEEKQKLLSVLNESYLNLKAQVMIWINRYLLISPVNGIVTFTKYWSPNQTVNTGEPVLNVIPENEGAYIGRISLPMQKSGKVKIGETVNIKLSGFPYLEYGMVRGFVRSKSLVSSGDSYIIEISLPQELTTLYGKKLEFTQNMQGRAEILTDRLRLIQKMVNPFRHLATRNRS